MNVYDIKCRIVEEELKTFWPQWHVVKRLGGGAFGDVYQIYRDKYGIRVESALKIIQISDEMAAGFRNSADQGTGEGKTQKVSETAGIFRGNPQKEEPEPENAGPSWDPENIPEDLRNEIRIMEALRGAPNIVVIEDFHCKREGTSNSLFVRMELLSSFQEILHSRLKKRELFSQKEVLKIGRDVCTALMYCEKKGIIHRDLKPANLFVDEFGNFKVGDFGVSKRLDTVHLAHTMTGVGTISYMAPEIYRGQSYNNTVDIYALGLILYQLLNSGCIPFIQTSGAYNACDIDSANYRRLHGEPVPSLAGIPTGFGDETVDPALDAILRKAFAPRVEDRYQTARDFYQALDSWENGQSPGLQHVKGNDLRQSSQSFERKSGNPPASGRQKRRQKIQVCLILLAAAFFLLLGAGVIIMHQQQEVRSGSSVITDSWEEIIAAGENGTYAAKYRIGDQKELDLGEEGTVLMELVAMDADELADGSGTAPMTWVAKSLLTSDHCMNAAGTNAGGWQESDLRLWLQDSIFPLLPEPVRSNVKEVTKYSYSRTENGPVGTKDLLWIPSVREVLGGTDWEDCGPEYAALFSEDEKRHRYHPGDPEPAWWWLRSASSRRTGIFSSVHYYGNRFGDNASVELGVVIGFCL